MRELIDRMQVLTYTGTMESLEDLVRNLELDSDDYSFNVLTKFIFIHSVGISYRPGDSYIIILPETLEAIG